VFDEIWIYFGFGGIGECWLSLLFFVVIFFDGLGS
jgi:hypothetical protein